MPDPANSKPRWIYPLDHLRSLPDGSLTAAEVGLLCDEIERYSGLLDEWDEFWDEGFSDDYDMREKVRAEIARFCSGYADSKHF